MQQEYDIFDFMLKNYEQWRKSGEVEIAGELRALSVPGYVEEKPDTVSTFVAFSKTYMQANAIVSTCVPNSKIGIGLILQDGAKLSLTSPPLSNDIGLPAIQVLNPARQATSKSWSMPVT